MQRLAKLTALAVAGGALASCTPEVPQTTISWTERRAQLPNGMKVVVLPDTSTQLVQVDVRYEVGANEDPPGKAGLAHLVEHMMFQHRPLGPDKPPTFEIIPRVATTFNAYTIWDKTHYYIEAPKEDLETVLRLEAFRMNAGCDTIPPAQFEREREVVRNEIRQRGGSAEGLVQGILSEALYPAGHPYSHTVGGDDKQLSNIVFQDTCDFMKKYYTPERTTLVITGNVDEATVSKLVGANFGGIAPRPSAPRAEVKPIELTARTIEKTLDLEKPTLLVAWKLPAMTDPEWDNVNALFNGVGNIARLANEYDECIRDVGVTLYGGSLAPTFLITMELCDNDHFEQALGWVWKGAASGSWGLKNAELDDDTKILIKQSFIENFEQLAARNEWIAEFIQFQKDRYKIDQERQILFDELDRLDRLNADGFASFARKTFRKDKAVVIKLKASDKGQKGDQRSSLAFTAKTHDEAIQPDVDPAEANRPLPAPKSASILAKAERYKLGNGMDVILLPTESPVPTVRARLVFRAGAAHESTHLAGLASLAAGMLAPELDADFMKTGVSVSGFSNDDTTTFSSGGLNMYSDVIITALERVVKVGIYDQRRVEEWQKRARQRLDSEQYREQQQFTTDLYAALFGPSHDYTVKGVPTAASIGNLGYDALTAFKRAHYEARNATLIVVGAFDVPKVKTLVSDTFGEWEPGDADKAVGPNPAPRSAPVYRGIVASKPGPQMQVTIAYPAPAGGMAGGIDQQYAERLVLTEMLSSRMGRIRTELGSTYGIRARLSRNVGPNAYFIDRDSSGAPAEVDGQRAGETLKAMRDKIDGLRRGEGFEVDFVTARRTVLKNLVGVSSEPSQLASRLGSIATFNLPPDYYDQLTRKVAQVTPAQVKALIAAELKPELEVIVAKADKVTLDQAFGAIGVKYQ